MDCVLRESAVDWDGRFVEMINICIRSQNGAFFLFAYISLDYF